MAYRIVTAMVFVVTVLASVVCFRGNFSNPVRGRFIYFKFHPYWNKMLLLAALKGLTQGFLVTAPDMLMIRRLGQQGALGTAQHRESVVQEKSVSVSFEAGCGQENKKK